MIFGMLLLQPCLPRLFPRNLDIGRVEARNCRRSNASRTDTQHQPIVHDIAIKTRVVPLQPLGRDTVGTSDAFACILVGALMNELAVVAVAPKTEPGADFEVVAVSATCIEQVESEDLVGGCEGFLTDFIAGVAGFDGVVACAGGVV